MRISDWSSDVCSSDLRVERPGRRLDEFQPLHRHVVAERIRRDDIRVRDLGVDQRAGQAEVPALARLEGDLRLYAVKPRLADVGIVVRCDKAVIARQARLLAFILVVEQSRVDRQPPVEEESGQASCRERGWPYVWLSGVAVYS